MKFPTNEIISLLDERLEFNLAESTNKDLVLKEIWSDALAHGLPELKLEYGSSQGSLALRELLAKKLQLRPADIVLTQGAAFGTFLTLLCQCAIGDEVITVQPNFPPTLDLIEGLGFKRRLLRLSFETQYRLNEDDLFKMITDNTRLIILVSPLNPSGTTLGHEQLKRIASCLYEQYPKCKLLVDETYREATYGDALAMPTTSGLSKNLITVASLSKSHGVPGLRIGWLCATDADFINQLRTVKMNTVLSNSVLDEYVALQLLKKEAELLRSRSTHALAGLERTRNWVTQNERFVRWIEPEAGALCCIQLRPTHFDSEKTALFYDLAKQQGIQLAQGAWFGETNSIFRLGFGYMPSAQLGRSLDKLTEVLKAAAAAESD